MNKENVRIVGLLLAAGAGARFGGAYPGAKLDQIVDGVTVGVRSFNAMHAACDATIVIVRDEASLLAQHAHALGAQVILAEAPERGVGRSIAQGAIRASKLFTDAQCILISMADMPWVDNHIYGDLVPIALGDGANSENRIVQPVFKAPMSASEAAKAHDQRPGHPVAFGRAHWPALMALDGDLGARSIIEANRKHLIQIATSHEGIWRDVDQSSDLE
jgi:molybdenum cofactor cytidylyltransferase